MIVIKRDGKREEFNQNKISLAIAKAVNSMDSKKITDVEINEIVVTVMQECEVFGEMTVEVIQDRVEDLLYKLDKSVAKGYKAYRLQRTEIRDKKSPLMKSINNIARKDDASSVDNANVGSNFSAKLLGIASEGNKWTILASLPKWIAHLHLDGRLYQHDLDAYNLTINCLHLKTGEILKRGFNTSYGPITEPHRIMSAAALSCILVQSSQNDMFGGQSHADFDNDLAPYVEMTRKEIIDSYIRFRHTFVSENEWSTFIEDKVEEQVAQAMQSVIFNLNTMHSRAGR